MAISALRAIWESLDGHADLLERVQMRGPQNVLASAFPVTELATSAVGCFALAAAETFATRNNSSPPAIQVDRAHAALSYDEERQLVPIGWPHPGVRHEMSRDYPTSDGWVRLHMNYAHHRAAALEALGGVTNLRQLQSLCLTMTSREVEDLVVARGGCAAEMHDLKQWSDHPQGRAVATEPLVGISQAGDATGISIARPAARPLDGLKVLDLTRVISGPTCTGLLAHVGAHVLRIDPVGFEEMPALLPITTAGKRRTSLDLTSQVHRRDFEKLIASADVLVAGFRSDAMARLGYDETTLRSLNEGLLIAKLNAYGWTGPWRARRGFDSLVQMSAGIAAHGASIFGTVEPTPLPVQALDYTTGYLLAAAICRALTSRLLGTSVGEVSVSLARTAAFLTSMKGDGEPGLAPCSEDVIDRYRREFSSSYGKLRKICWPVTIPGSIPVVEIPAGPLGVDPPTWFGP
jgi:hypothetical protein